MEILLGLVLVLVAAFVPMILYSGFMWWLDRYEKEPWWMLLLVFAWGAVPAVILALIAQLVTGFSLSITDWSEANMNLAMASVVAPLTEETAKGLAVLLVFLFFRREIDSLLDGVIYGSLVGFGFAATENVLYGLQALAVGGVEAVLFLAFLRSIVFGLNHAFFTALTGIGLAFARHGSTMGGRMLLPLTGLAMAMIFHGLHNLGASLVGKSVLWLGFSFAVDWFGIIGIILLVVVTLNLEKRWLLIELREEVAAGELTGAELRVLVSSMRRSWNLVTALFQHGLGYYLTLSHFYQTATELAFQKRHWKELRDDPQAVQRIQALRSELAALRRRIWELDTEVLPRR